jgi:1-acyl-sn-glycerol-3-phosphate acyltransferase
VASRHRVPALLNAPLAALAYLVTVAAILVGLPLQLLLLAVTRPFDPDRRISGRFLRLVGSTPTYVYPFWHARFQGRFPRDRRAYVVVSNHQSMLDVFLLSRLPREMKWMAKEELFRIPWVGWMFSLSGDIRVDRGSRTSGGKALVKIQRYLRNGTCVMMFPEGTRSRDGRMLPFKPGAFKAAIDAQVPVLPVAVSGSADGMPKGSPWIRPTLVLARVLEPVETAGLGSDDVDRLCAQVRERIAAAEAELRAEREAEGW